MNKYIEVDKLIELIDAKLEDLGMSGSVWVGRSVLQELKNDITSPQQEQIVEYGPYARQYPKSKVSQEQPEVDIEKEIVEHAENMPHGEFTHESECIEHEKWARAEFRHFYELGLNAIKEESK